jgi:hypothetical protein
MTTDTAAPLHILPRTWRSALLMAIVVASKVVYDEKVFLADYREQLPQYRLNHVPQQELAFLGLLNYNSTVRRGQYARYYYALEVRAATARTANSATQGSALMSPFGGSYASEHSARQTDSDTHCTALGVCKRLAGRRANRVGGRWQQRLREQ